MKILQVEKLCKVYGTGDTAVKALQDVTFSMEKGEFAAVVGESGSGKSTLLNCIGALDTPTSGRICLDGTDLFGMKENQRTLFRRRNVGFIFQSFQLIQELDPTLSGKIRSGRRPTHAFIKSKRRWASTTP